MTFRESPKAAQETGISGELGTEGHSAEATQIICAVKRWDWDRQRGTAELLRTLLRILEP